MHLIIERAAIIPGESKLIVAEFRKTATAAATSVRFFLIKNEHTENSVDIKIIEGIIPVYFVTVVSITPILSY